MIRDRRAGEKRARGEAGETRVHVFRDDDDDLDHANPLAGVCAHDDVWRSR